MSKLIRRTAGRKKEIGAALIVALQLTTLTLIGLMAPFASGPQQSATAPAESEMSAAPTQTVQTQTASTLSDRRASAVSATKLYEPRATEILNLAATRAESAQQSVQEGEATNEATTNATLTTDRE